MLNTRLSVKSSNRDAKLSTRLVGEAGEVVVEERRVLCQQFVHADYVQVLDSAAVEAVRQ